ncbi:MAG: WYL domain-containing protein [Ruminococcus sp.]|nr:WYL domain-containing protein [Ruminococcus sp.]
MSSTFITLNSPSKASGIAVDYFSNRPKCINPECIINKTESGDIYLTFECTQQQIYQYFIKFGSDDEIIAPSELRERFKELHKLSLEYYIND